MDGTAATPTPTEIIHVDEPVVACDGGGGALGHPRVFLRIEDRSVMCPYCSRLYVLIPGSSPGTSEGAGHGTGH
jgi:uncharacterized Zn-finger protein